MTLPADHGFREAATTSHIFARQLWVCDQDTLLPLSPLPIAVGTSIQVTPNLVRRQGQIVLPNPDGLYSPGAGIVDFGRPYLLRFGLQDDAGGWLWCDQPLLWPDEDESDVGSRIVTLAVSDGMRIVSADAQLSNPVLFADGTLLEAVLRFALVACGAPDEARYFDFDAGGAVLTGDHGYEVGTRWADIITQLLTDYSLDLWAGPPLVYSLRPIPDPATAPIVATWAIGSGVQLAGLKRRRLNLARNHATVSGVDLNGNPVQGEVFDLNPESLVQWGRPGVGDLPVMYHSDGIATLDRCLEVGRTLLTSKSVSTALEATVPIDPSLDRRDVVLHEDVRYMLDSFPLPIEPGVQMISVQEARTLQ